MTDKRRVAIIGCGFFAPNHIHSWQELEGAELVAVCDTDLDRARVAAAMAGTAFYVDATTMLVETKPDLVDIVTTAPSHLALARICASRQVPAIIQKPLAFSLAEALQIADLAARSGVPMMVHENFRFQRPIRKVKSLIAAGVIGEPRYCSIGFRCGHDVFTGQPYLRDDERLVLSDIGVHVFDVARFLMGEITDLSCRVQRVRGDVRGEDMASALVGFASGAMGLVEASWSSFLPEDPFPEVLLTIEGTQGSVVLDRHFQIKCRSGGDVRSYSAEPPCHSWAVRPWHVVQDSVVETCRHWLDASNQGVSPETSVADNVKTLALVEACYASAAAGGTVIRAAEVLARAARREDP
jgi:predicted dehydrogenase